jgi:hypothetical protein
MSEILVYDNLFAGNVSDVVTDTGTLLSGQNVARGAVIALVTASNKFTIVDSTKTLGEEIPYAIVADDCDATSADKPVNMYLTGEFNSAALTFGGTDTAATHKTALRNKGIFLKTNVKV